LFFHRKTAGLRWRELISSLLKVALAIIPMSLATMFIERSYSWNESGHYMVKIPLIGGGVIAAMLIFFLCSYLLRNRELRFLWEAMRSGRGRQGPSSTHRA